MRHGKSFNHLGRKKGHRRALLMNLSNALIEHKRINTTLAKAKALRVYLEPLITKSKKNTTHSRRVVFSYLQSKEAIKELFGPIAAEIGQRPGGYLRIIKTGFRQSDGAEMGMIEFVDFNKTYDIKGGSSRKTRRSRRSGGAAKEQAPVSTTSDLKKIEGIGPKVAEILNQGGITTFAQLADTGAADIKAMLDEAGGTFAAMDPTTWPEQAKLAADGKWDELKTWQDELDGGRTSESE